jgi:uncharacterized membrane protein
MSKLARLYVRADCPLCDEAAHILKEAGLQVRIIDVEQERVLHQLYGRHVPVADLGDNVRLYWPFAPTDVQAALGRAADEQPVDSRAPLGDRTRHLVMVVDRLVGHFSRHWLLFIAFVAGLYAGLPLLAPILLAAGLATPANAIYAVYRLLCHQLPSRSSFILGQQICYCDRCLAIYSALFVGVLGFALVRQHLKPLPWQIYVALVVPMAVDGITQTVGLRYSNFELRVVTGSLFGLGSAWLALPYLEQGFRDVVSTVERKIQLA